MLGQVFSPVGREYNLIILAGGAGTRMGDASEYIPKALTEIGGSRAIDYIIRRYAQVTDRLIVGAGYHADLLENYVLGTYLGDVYFSRESVPRMKNDGLSTIYCLDYADSRLGTIIVYCDLLPLSNFGLQEDSILVATPETSGVVGTFRNKAIVAHDKIVDIERLDEPTGVGADCTLGVLGTFVLENTPLLKTVAYGTFNRIEDLTQDIVLPYVRKRGVRAEPCDQVIEFGTEFDLYLARGFWEDAGW